MNEVTGRLESWYYDHALRVYYGHIYDDVKKRWWDGAFIHTSHCPYPNKKEGDIIETRNSTYLLGKPLEMEK